MANFDLLSSLAEIAGIFIGFGALIVLSGRDEEDPAEMGMVRQVVVNLVQGAQLLAQVVYARIERTSAESS